jgi:hypothetical protein
MLPELTKWYQHHHHHPDLLMASSDQHYLVYVPVLLPNRSHMHSRQSSLRAAARSAADQATPATTARASAEQAAAPFTHVWRRCAAHEQTKQRHAAAPCSLRCQIHECAL